MARLKQKIACIYCRRSHMTCDEGRPCKRCIKRDIGHLCHDETTSKSSQSQKVERRSSQISNSSATSKTKSPSRVVNGVSVPPPSAIASTSTPTTVAPSAFLNQGEGPSSTLHMGRISTSPNLTLNYDSSSQNNGFNWGTSVLGGAGFLGLGGGDISGLDADVTASGDAAGGNEFNILSEFLESLDGSAVPTPGVIGSSSYANNSNLNFDVNLQSSPSRPSNQPLTGVSAAAAASYGNTTETNNLWSTQAEGSGWPIQSATNALVANALGGSSKNSRRPSLSDATMTASSSNMGGVSSKTEKFFLTAADQKDGTRDERLGRVIQAKYDAGLLRPYNHVNGYARLNRWMEQNASQASRRRILKPISIFRPAFRAIAQSLTNVDLIFIEEAFERLLLDYDRVFSTQGIPACLWRRTGEIYKGNKEFAELVGVGIEALRDGRCTIYEFMQEESAVNYWEKYGAVSFDPGQKAVLTSCVLKTRRKGVEGRGAAIDDDGDGSKMKGGEAPKVASTTPTDEDGFVSCCFSFTIRRDAWSIPCLIVGNFLPCR